MIPKGWNTNRYRNPTVDKLLDQARSSQDREERKALYAQIQDTLAESAAWIPIYNTKEIMVIAPTNAFWHNPVLDEEVKQYGS